jgi:hypothetical protein
MRVYRTYEFYHKRPPSILGALLGSEESPNDTPLIPNTVKSMAYVGIFPLSSHFNTLVQHLPRLEKLFVQLVPRDRDLLTSKEEMRSINPSDLWMERNTCYSHILRELFRGDDASGSKADGNWKCLKEFESGDAADREAWDMAVNHVLKARTAWTVEREGVFVKRPQAWQQHGNQQTETEEDESSDGQGGTAELLWVT